MAPTRPERNTYLPTNESYQGSQAPSAAYKRHGGGPHNIEPRHSRKNVALDPKIYDTMVENEEEEEIRRRTQRPILRNDNYFGAKQSTTPEPKAYQYKTVD